MNNFINLTPHTINILSNTNELVLSIPSTGVARVNTNEEIVNSLSGIPVIKTEYTDVENLPEPKENTVYIVSILVLTALKGSREDVVAPNTGKSGVVRDENGQILEVKSFITI